VREKLAQGEGWRGKPFGKGGVKKSLKNPALGGRPEHKEVFHPPKGRAPKKKKKNIVTKHQKEVGRGGKGEAA